MKKISTLFLSSLFSLSLFAFDGSRLSISATGAAKELKVEIDGRAFLMQNNVLTLGYLQEGFHTVKIFREIKNTRGRSMNRRDNGFGYNPDRGREILFNSQVVLKRGFHTDITINRFGKVMTDERRIDLDDEWYNDEDEYFDQDNNQWGGRADINMMSGREFEDLKQSLRKEWFENNRLKSVQNITGKINFTTQQVKELMELFVFESNRVEVAKAAYNKTLDKENYYRLNEVLTFSSSKEDLARYIRECR